MQATVKELMQLKNEIANTIQTLQRDALHSGIGMGGHGSIEYGTEYINDRQTIRAGDTTPFPQHYARLSTLFEFSNALNTALERANVEHGITRRVRERENIKALLRVTTTALQHSKPYHREDSINVAGGDMERVRKRYEPFVTSAALKTRARELKQQLRTIQAEIDDLNGRTVEVNMTRADLEEVLDA